VSHRALSFGTAAAAYEHFRLGYPDDVVDLVLAYAGRPLQTALEIGAGTGKATRLFAARGIAVTATDPDAAMLAELSKHVPRTVTTVCTAFEELPSGPTYDCVFAAAALHWTEPERRWERVAALLSPGGVFASFGGPAQLADPALRDVEHAARSIFGETVDPVVLDAAVGREMHWPGTELEKCEWFDDVEQHIIARRATVTAHEYVGQLSTLSSYLILSSADRPALAERLLAALPECVELEADVILHLARRR
jgi:SAM-dependent methyltransferase